MVPAEQHNQQLAATFTALFTTLKEQSVSLEQRVSSLEAENARISKRLAALESDIGLDLMLAKIIIDR